MAEQFVYGYGLVDGNLFCEFVNEHLGRYLGIASKRCLSEIVHPEDADKFHIAIDPVISGKANDGMAVLRLMTAEAGYRECRMKVTRQNDGECRIEIVDVLSSLDKCVDYIEATGKTAFLLEKQGTLIFEYDYSKEKLELYKYDRTEKVILNQDDKYATLAEIMLEDFKHPKEGAVAFDFEKNYNVNGTHFYVKGNDLIRNASKYVLIGTIENIQDAGEERNSDSDHCDAMTGLYNKPYSLSLARESMASHEKISICMIDIDDFKTINDTFGHVFGDEVIKKLAVILREVTANRGFAGRFGGDEFFICLYDVETEQELRTVLQAIFYHYKRAFADVDHTFSLTMGISEYPRNGEDFDFLLKKADRALYIGKFKGKNRYIIYKEYIHGELTDEDGVDKILSEKENSNRLAQTAFLRECMSSLSICMKNNGTSPKPLLDEIFGKLLGCYKFEGVNIYAGENFDNIYSFGWLSNPMPNTSYMKLHEVVSQFNDNGIFHTVVKYVRNRYVEEFHGYMEKHGITNSLQIMVGSKDNIRALITYDTEKDLGSCSADETRDIMLLSQLVVALLLNE